MKNFPVRLLDGYRNFMDGRFAEEQERYSELAAAGQKPETMVIACCDSRAAPETVFGAGPGELFVVRNVANLVPPYAPDGGHHSTSAALEYAIQVLRVKHIVVMGHGRCGGIAASLDANMGPLSPGDFIGKWMGLVKQAAEDVTHYSHMSAGERQTAMERISVRSSIENLRTFPNITEQEKAGKLKLSGAWFDISSGELWIMESTTGDFLRPTPDLYGEPA